MSAGKIYPVHWYGDARRRVFLLNEFPLRRRFQRAGGIRERCGWVLRLPGDWALFVTPIPGSWIKLPLLRPERRLG